MSQRISSKLTSGTHNPHHVWDMKLCQSIKSFAVTGLLVATLFQARGAEDPFTTTEPSRFLPWEKGAIELGGFVAIFDSTLEFGTPNSNFSLNAEDLLDLDTSLTVFRVDALYRPGKTRRNQFDLSYAAYHRTGDTSLSRDITIDGVTYPAGSDAHTEFDFDIIRGTYSYAFLQNERVRLALGLGVYAVPLNYSIRIESEGTSRIEGADTVLPLPAVTMRAEWQIIPRLFLNGSVSGMYLEVSDFKGAFLDLGLGLEYRPWKHVGFGVGYNGMWVEIEGQSDDSDYPGVDFEGSVGVRYSGLLLYGKWTF